MDRLLPIGSIIKLGDTDYDILICGYGGKGTNNRVYDYIGVIYPYGFISKNRILTFDKNKVTKVVYEGHKNKKYEEIVDQMQEDIEAYKQVKGDK